MSQALVFGLIGAVLGGGLGVLIARDTREGPIFIASTQPVTELQLHDKLQSQGWESIQVTRLGLNLEATGSRDGRPQKVIINAFSGRLVENDNDDD
jgi:ABC-type lipoprotein release transport system permease subunit